MSDHMDGLISSADAARVAADTRLTADEARAVRLAAGIGVPSPQERVDLAAALRSAAKKLRAIERGGGQ